MRGKSLTMDIGPAKPMPKIAKPLPKMKMPDEKAKPKTPMPQYRTGPSVTQRQLDRAPEADDVLITTPRGRAMAARLGNPNVIRTTVRERTTPMKKGK